MMDNINCWLKILDDVVKEKSPIGIIDHKDCYEIRNMLDELNFAIQGSSDEWLKSWYYNYFLPEHCFDNDALVQMYKKRRKVE